MILTSYISGHTIGKWSLILTSLNKQLKSYSPAKKTSPIHPQLIFNGTIVKKVSVQKHLGLTFDSGLTFKKHIDEKITKAMKNLGLIKHVSKCLPFCAFAF